MRINGKKEATMLLDTDANAYLAFHESGTKRLSLRKGSESKQGKNAFNQDTVIYNNLYPLKIEIGSLSLQYFNHVYPYDKSWGKASFLRLYEDYTL